MEILELRHGGYGNRNHTQLQGNPLNMKKLPYPTQLKTATSLALHFIMVTFF